MKMLRMGISTIWIFRIRNSKERILVMGRVLCCLWLLFCCSNIQAQNTIGLPNVTNFTSEQYNAGAQNWMITQDRFGILYFANTEGLLTYNGDTWNMYPLPNKTLVRSLKIDKDGKIYAGGQDEFGYYFPSKNGTLQYHSLKKLIPGVERSFADVWNTAIIGKDIFFRCSDRIFHIDSSKKVQIFRPAVEWTYMAQVGNKLFVQDKDSGLFLYNNNKLRLISTATNKKIITSILAYDSDAVLITTLKDGVFVLSQNQLVNLPIDKKIAVSHIYTSLKTGSNSFALGTTSNGVYFIDKKGNTIRHLSRDSRLQNNNVLSMFLDNQSNLWLGLDKGIDLVNSNSAVQKISPVVNTPAACYTAQIYNNKLFIGTSDGLYSTPLTLPTDKDLSFSKGLFTRVANSGGQVWGLLPTPEGLLMGHNEGTFLVNNEVATPVYKNEGTWLYKILPQTVGGQTDIIAGTYTGFRLMTVYKGRIIDSGGLGNSIYESLRFLEIDSINHIIWAAHPYRGIYKFTFQKGMHKIVSVRLYTQKDGLPSNLNNYVYSIRHQIVFCTQNGLYTYNTQLDKFEQNAYYRKIFGNISLRLVKEDKKNNIWFVSGKKLGVVLPDGTVKYFSEITGKLISGFEFIYPLNEQNIFVGSSDGLIHINFVGYQQKKPEMQLLLTKVLALGTKDSVLYNGYFVDKDELLATQSPDNIDELSANFNAFHFEFGTTMSKQPNDIQYSFQLEGFDKQWSKWSSKNEKDYTNLSYGKYTFLVKSKDNFNHESKVIKYTFIINPHWYQTNLAYLFYAICALALLALISRVQAKKFEKQKQKYEKEQKQLQYLHQLEIEHNEREIIQLQKEKLETDIAFKNKELATTTMHLFKRGKLLSKLKEELLIAIKKLPTKENSRDFTLLVKMLNEAEKQDEGWEQFSIHFDEVHNNFLKNLKTTYPELTQSDLKICAYLKMNLSSKEIAQLLNISLKGVEVARYRLRKKLQIPSSDVNLYDFLVES